jgi:hypothetical protein
MFKAEILDEKAAQAEQQAVNFPRLQAQYLLLAKIWRNLARQARFMDGPVFR